MSDRPGKSAKLSWKQRRSLALLGLPTFGLALAATMVSTYLPVFINKLSGPALAGAMIGGEGFFGLFLPLLVGTWSDSVDTRFGSRLPFLLAAGPVLVVALILMPLMHAVLPLALLLALFYVGYFTYYAPYRALYPDVVPDDLRSRSQGAQKTWREAGLGVALVGGGVLLGVGRVVPFLLAAAVVAAVTAVFAWRARDPGEGEGEERQSVRQLLGNVRELIRARPQIGWLVAANSLWELTVAALKTFAVLYITVGLGRSSSIASAVLALVAVSVVAAALIAGVAGDRVGPLPLMRSAAWVYAVGLVPPLFVHSGWLVLVIPPTAFAAGVIMTLPYAELMGMLEEEHHGAASGVFGFSRGLGILLGPVLAGVAVTVLKGPLTSTHGYGAVFGVASAAVFISIFCLRRLKRAERREDARRRTGQTASANASPG